MLSSENIEEFTWRGITIRQQNDVFKIGTDALLLGSWIPRIIDNPVEILEAGTGTGILALMMAYYFPKGMVTAVDREEVAVKLTQLNVQNSLWPDRINIQQEDILTASLSEKEKYDLILSNPPYFFDQMPSISEVKKNSKHAISSSKSWMSGLKSRLKNSGHVCIIIPYELAKDWISAANENELYCRHRMDVSSFDDEANPKRSLLHFHTDLVRPETSRLTIYEKGNHYTEAYLSFTGISVDKFDKR